ncbi:D-hexose-6-phosphate mutarotase [uncultured Pseudacidovorax sp.]|uniref:D-hexose-6-phosphate mutarotase n=1 Tax=uncultured Pseudacidovorax sp. TaxID=679313 RepID=UPI0025FF763D|nr:D-hexose-6-phosphate mutarotase [uncultured Pseudacidovorax sp.]
MSLREITVQGQPAVELSATTGDQVTVALHGGHVLSWRSADGTERLYLSPKAVFDGRAAIRGGVPVCFPQFNQRGPLVKHGFARNLPWQVVPDAAADTVSLGLTASDETLAVWPELFQLRLNVHVPKANLLRIDLQVRNTGTTPWPFTAALHSYLQVDDLADVQLQGLQGAARWDAVRDERSTEGREVLRFGEEFDSVYAAPAHPLVLRAGSGELRITAAPTCPETVVWNPGPALCARLADMPADGWRHMLCVEAAAIDTPVELAPGSEVHLWQQLDARPSSSSSSTS